MLVVISCFSNNPVINIAASIDGWYIFRERKSRSYLEVSTWQRKLIWLTHKTEKTLAMTNSWVVVAPDTDSLNLKWMSHGQASAPILVHLGELIGTNTCLGTCTMGNFKPTMLNFPKCPGEPTMVALQSTVGNLKWQLPGAVQRAATQL